MIEKAKKHFMEVYEESGCKRNYPEHIHEMIKWIEKLLKQYPEADKEVLLVSAWLHDIGDILEGDRVDHAISSEKEARRFLEENNYEKGKLRRVAQCIRAHRNTDVAPETTEDKIIVVSDSASHMTMSVYIRRLNEGLDALSKLERDYADFDLFPEVKEELKPVYNAWKQLINVYPKL